MKRLALGAFLTLVACRPSPPKSPSVVAVDGTKGPGVAIIVPRCADETAEAATEDDGFGRKISAICIEGASPGARIKIEGAIELKVGDALSADSVVRTLSAVHKTHVADDVAVYGRKLGPGIIVVIRIHERARVGKVTVEGTVLANIKRQPPPGPTPLSPGEYYDPAYAHERAEEARAAYFEQGLEETTVTPQTSQAGDGIVDVHMVIVEGVRLTIGKITSAGITRSFEAELLKNAGLVRGDPLTLATGPDAVTRVEAFYYDRGNLTVTVKVERGAREADASVPLTITAREGPQFRLGKITLTKSGLDPAAARALLARLKSQSGSIFRRSVFVTDIALIKQAYIDRGRTVTVEPSTSIDTAKNTVDVALEIADQP